MARNQFATFSLNLLGLCGLVVLFSIFVIQLLAFAESDAADIDVKAIIKGMGRTLSQRNKSDEHGDADCHTTLGENFDFGNLDEGDGQGPSS